jgi:hypothetical protein
MIYTCLKYQDETPWANNIYFKNEGQEGKTGPVQEWVVVEVGWLKSGGRTC